MIEFERKRNAADDDRIREAICAFANDLPGHRQPGVVFVGVEDDGSCSQIPITDELLRTLGGMRDDGAVTPFPVMEVRKCELGGCTVAVVIVQPSDNPPVRYRGRTWIRVGPRRAIATPEEERRLVEKRRWGNLPFDAQPVMGSQLADLDLNRFTLEYVPALVSTDTAGEMSPLGYVVSRYSSHGSRAAKAFQRWLDRAPQVYAEAVLDLGEESASVGEGRNRLAQLKDYRSLMPMAQEARKPMFLLKPADGAIGGHQSAVQECYADFDALAAEIERRIGMQ